MASTSASGSRQPLSGEQQEQIIKQRMLVDERSLRRLVKKLTLLLASKDAESVASSRLSFQADLEAFRLQLQRLSAISRNTSQLEIKSYSKELQDIDAEQARTQERIDALKRRLREVRRDRKNKLEYDVVASEVVKLPTRKELEEGMERVREEVEGGRGERGKYAELAKGAKTTLGEVIGLLGELRDTVGYEVGERERREVERADGDAEPEEEEKREMKASGDDREEGEEEEGAGDRSGSSTPRAIGEEEDRAKGGLNPAAATFRPAAVAVAGRRKRDSSAVVGSDEEGEVGAASSDLVNSNSNTPRKRQRTEEGEVGSEEEEGSIQPSAAAAAEGGRARAGNKRRR